MTRLVDQLRRCDNAPPELGGIGDDELLAVLERELSTGYRILDLLVDIGCEVAVEEVCYALGIWERP